MPDRMVAVFPRTLGFPQAARQEGGKSELRRAVCRITSGRTGSSSFDGKCHREHTASGERSARAVSLEPDARAKQAKTVAEPSEKRPPEVRVKRSGKSAPPGQ